MILLPDIAKGLIAIAKLTDEPKIVNQTSRLITQIVPAKSEDNFPVEVISKWIEGILLIIKHDWIKVKGIQLSEKFIILGNVGDFLNACTHLHECEKNKEIWARFGSPLGLGT